MTTLPDYDKMCRLWFAPVCLGLLLGWLLLLRSAHRGSRQRGPNPAPANPFNLPHPPLFLSSSFSPPSLLSGWVTPGDGAKQLRLEQATGISSRSLSLPPSFFPFPSHFDIAVRT